MLKSESKVGLSTGPPSAAPITTFYSYKGGVGRSMALANVAHLLADRYGKRVLIVDWDLEAPGLHRFFGIESRNVKRGLLDLLEDYKELLRTAQDSLPEPLVKLDGYMTSIRRQFHSGGSLTLLAAGRQDERYAARVNGFNWDDFYANWHGFGFIAHLRTLLQQAADVVLLDSRTGVTDIGGICTLQLPDSVVLLFAMNEQNLAGTEFAIGKIREKSPAAAERQEPPLLILRPARVERAGNQDRKIEWEKKAADRLGDYLTELDSGDPVVFMKKRNIPYIGDYSYGEVPLAAVKDPLGDLAEAFDDLARSVLQTAGLLDEDLQAQARDRRQARPATTLRQLGAVVAAALWVGGLPLVAPSRWHLLPPLGVLFSWLALLLMSTTAAVTFWLCSGRAKFRSLIIILLTATSITLVLYSAVRSLVVVAIPVSGTDIRSSLIDPWRREAVDVVVGFGRASGCGGASDAECVKQSGLSAKSIERLWGARNVGFARLMLAVSFLIFYGSFGASIGAILRHPLLMTGLPRRLRALTLRTSRKISS